MSAIFAKLLDERSPFLASRAKQPDYLWLCPCGEDCRTGKGAAVTSLTREKHEFACSLDRTLQATGRLNDHFEFNSIQGSLSQWSKVFNSSMPLPSSFVPKMFVPHRLPHRSLSFTLSSSTFVKREDTGVEAA